MIQLPLTPDTVREKALDILSGRREGIKQADLFKKTEAALSEKYIVPAHAVKNALWDLADRYENFVVKKKTSYRDVSLYPTDDLVQAAPVSSDSYLSKVEPMELSEDQAEYLAKMSSPYAQGIVKVKFLELYGALEFSGILADMANIQLNHLKEMSPSELEQFFKLKTVLTDMRKLRNEIAHNSSD